MKAGVLWMLMVCLSDGKDSLQKCKVETVVTVSKLSKVSVPCPPVPDRSSELNYVLLFNDTYIDQIQINKQSGSLDSLFSCLFEVTANNSGAYICRREGIYPPPFDEECYTMDVVIAEMQQLPSINRTDVNEANQSSPVSSVPEMVLWTGSGVLLFYSLSITAITMALWRKIKSKDEDANIYMNTRPREFKKPCKA